MRSVLLALTLVGLVAAKAKPHAYATPTKTPDASPQVIADERQVVFAQEPVMPANFSDETAAETADMENEEDQEEDPQRIMARNPIVQIAKHISHGMLDPDHDPPYVCRHAYQVQIVERDPLIIYIKNFLQPGEAEWMISAAAPVMARSMVAHSETNSTAQNNKKDEQRTSSSAFMNRGQDEVMKCIESRAADFVGEERSHMEGLQVVWYQENQKYNPHFDYFPPDSHYYEAYTANGGQRTYTFFVYLTDATYDLKTGERVELEGGHTSFPKLGISFPPEKGSAVFWTNFGLDGKEDERVLHGGDPVIRGQKMALNVWFREHEVN